MTANEHILAGDIGGTTTRLVLAPAEAIQHWHNERRYPSQSYPDFDSLLADYLASCEITPRRACFAIAGPVLTEDGNRRANITNLPWLLDSRALAQQHGLETVELVNDFAAIGHALDALQPEDTVCLQAGQSLPGFSRAIIGAGTGLGHANVVPCGDGIRVVAAEGGHTDFAPRSEDQWQLLCRLQQDFGHASWEDLLSGRGLTYLYRYFQERDSSRIPDAIRAALDKGDAAAQITAAAMDRSEDPAAVLALREFVSLYGAQAGNWALYTLPYSGLFIAGGIAPRILDYMQEGDFLASFRAKGRMTDLMHQFPVHIITHPQPGLLGALNLAGGS